MPSLLNLGDVLAAAAEFEEAIAVTRRAVALRERSASPDSLDLAEALDHLGSALSGSRRYDDALKAFDRSLSSRRRHSTKTDVAIARTLEAIGLVLQRTGSYERRIDAPSTGRGNTGGRQRRPSRVCGTLNLIAQQLWFEGQLIESRNASERAVAIAERTLRPDHPTVAQSLRYLAATLADLGDLTSPLP